MGDVHFADNLVGLVLLLLTLGGLVLVLLQASIALSDYALDLESYQYSFIFADFVLTYGAELASLLCDTHDVYVTLSAWLKGRVSRSIVASNYFTVSIRTSRL